MTKETLTIENAKKDLLTMVKYVETNKTEVYWLYIIPLAPLAIVVGICTQKIWVGLLVFALSSYHIVKLVIEKTNYYKLRKKLKGEIERGAFSVSRDKFSHIDYEYIYEPHYGYRRSHMHKRVPFVYFLSGARWRFPNIDRLYAWSKLYYMSPKGFDTTSVSGDEFYIVELQCDKRIVYVYNTKLFDFNEPIKD